MRRWKRSPPQPEAAARAALHTLNVLGRSATQNALGEASQKSRHATATKQTVTGKPQVTVFAPSFSITRSPAAGFPVRKDRTAPPAGPRTVKTHTIATGDTRAEVITTLPAAAQRTTRLKDRNGARIIGNRPGTPQTLKDDMHRLRPLAAERGAERPSAPVRRRPPQLRRVKMDAGSIPCACRALPPLRGRPREREEVPMSMVGG